MVLTKTSSSQIRKLAVETGMRTLREDGIQKVLEGITTLDEVVRATQED
jgi:type II secretory ATPase GspE/PulE/Tfp pilus assembly ATPase PilB-like protein